MASMPREQTGHGGCGETSVSLGASDAISLSVSVSFALVAPDGNPGCADIRLEGQDVSACNCVRASEQSAQTFSLKEVRDRARDAQRESLVRPIPQSRWTRVLGSP